MEQIKTKVVGVTMGPKNKSGQSLRQLYLNDLRTNNVKELILLREPDNAFDTDAIAVMADGSYGRVHIGYIKNSDKTCPGCGEFYPKSSNVNECNTCNSPLLRIGLASTLAQYLDMGVQYKATVLQYTSQFDIIGCNIIIQKINKI